MGALLTNMITGVAAVWQIPVVLVAMFSLAWWTARCRAEEKALRKIAERDAIAVVCGLVPPQRDRRSQS